MADLADELPPSSFALLKDTLLAAHFVRAEDFALPLHYRLMQAKDSLEFAAYLDVSEELSRRIYSLRQDFTGWDAFVDLVRTRQYTRSRVSRALLHIFLDIRQEMARLPKELRVLGFRREASDLLSEIKKKSRLPLVTKAAGHPELFFLSSRGVLQRTFQTTYHSLVLEAVDRSGDSSSSVHKVLAVEAVDRHDRSVAQKAAKLYIVSHFLSDNRNQADSRCLLVYHTNGHLVGDYACDGGCGGIARNSDHIETYGADTGHSFQFLDRKSACCYRVDHSLILADRNECAA